MKRFCSTILLLTFLFGSLSAKNVLLQQSFEDSDYTGYSTSYPFSVIGPDAFFYRAGSNKLDGISKLSGFDGNHYLCLQNTGPALGAISVDLNAVNIRDHVDLELQMMIGMTSNKLGKFNPESGIELQFQLDDGTKFTHFINLKDLQNGAVQTSSIYLDEVAGKQISGNNLTLTIKSYVGLGQAIAIDNIRFLGNLESAVEFRDTRVRNEHQIATVTWTTQKESNVDHFVLERKTENSSWEVVGDIVAKNTPYSWYQFTDPHPSRGINQYRVKAVFKDGAELEGDIHELQFDEAGAEELKIYPNPAENFIWFEWKGGPKTTYTFRVLDSYGNPLIWSELPATRTKGNIDIETLKDGIYILEFRKGNQVYDFRFVKK